MGSTTFGTLPQAHTARYFGEYKDCALCVHRVPRQPPNPSKQRPMPVGEGALRMSGQSARPPTADPPPPCGGGDRYGEDGKRPKPPPQPKSQSRSQRQQ